MNIFPVPCTIVERNGCLDLSGARWIILPSDSGFPLKKRVIEMAADLSRCFMLPVRVSCGMLSGRTVLIQMLRDEKHVAEGYSLSIEQSGPVLLVASDDAGFFYGLQTAMQLLSVPCATPCCDIFDRPSLHSRGYMLDVSRDKVPTMETVKKTNKESSETALQFIAALHGAYF